MSVSSTFRSEPIAITEAFKGLLVATLSTLQAFNVVHLSDTQQAVILAEYLAGSVALSAVARSLSTPTAKVAMTTAQATALNQAPPLTVQPPA